MLTSCPDPTMPKVNPKLRRAQKTSFCPDCGKRFANETWVLQHMNQPSNACGSWMNDLSRLHSHSSAAQNGINIHLVTNRTQHQPSPNRDAFPDADDAGGFRADEDTVRNPVDEHQDHTSVPVVDIHPNIPTTYPGGATFMDQFFNDQFAPLRHENLYYPFASGADWQLASWLLRSHLSMAAIDDFLSLKLVCFFFFFSRLKLTRVSD